MAIAKKVKKENSLISFIKGCGCFLMICFLFLGTISFVGFGYFAPVFSSVKKDAKLPDFEGPSERDFWSLQEKLLNEKDSGKMEVFFDGEWSLTPGEFNALLSSIQVPPVSGFCLGKIRHSYENKVVRYYFIGSGFMLKRLVISFVLQRDGKTALPSEILVNSWRVPSNTSKEKIVRNLIQSVVEADKTKILSNLFSGRVKPYE